MSLLIRACTPEDASEIERLYLQSVAHLQSLGDTDEFLFGAEVYLCDGFGENPAFAGLVAEAGERLLGYLLYEMNYDTDAAADLCRSLGGSELVWAVYHKNQLAFDFYLSLGAKEIADLRFMYWSV